MLKKEFKRKDVQRARNLLTGKTGASTSTQIGYKKETKDYKEGDVWTEGRKTWTIKNGIKQTVSKLDKIRIKFSYMRDEFSDEDWGKIKTYITQMGLKILDDSNYYEANYDREEPAEAVPMIYLQK